jgi:outer membrane protein
MNKNGLLKHGMLITALTFSGAAFSDVIGVHGKVAGWAMDYSGEFKDSSSAANPLVDIERDLGFDNEFVGFAEIAFEHPVPVLPNIKLVYTGIDTNESNTLSTNITFAGQTFNASNNVVTDFKADIYDFSMYYELLDNWVQADAGLTVRYMDIELQSEANTTPTTSASESFSTPLPLLYVNAQFDLPFTDVYGNVNINGLAIDEVTTYDAQASIGWMPLTFIGAEIGYRHLEIDADDLEDYEFNITLSGPFLAVKADF